jgi:trigger factor
MPHSVEKLENNRVKITVTIPKEQVEEGMRHTAEHVAEDTSIPGFRPGKATYEMVKTRMGGEMKLLEAASEELIRGSFTAAMIEENLETVGQPYFSMVKMVPGDDMVYTAEMALMPQVTKLADYAGLSLEKKETEPTDEIFAQAKTDLLRMRTKEVRAVAGRKLSKGDKAVVNMTMKREGVVLEGGEAQNHGVYTHEPYYIPGFIEKILEASEGEERSFTLKFPEDHYQKHLAGQDVDFHVKLNEIFTLEIPDWDDEFAKSLGMDSVSLLDAKLRENLKLEKEQEETRRQEKEVLELIANKSTFDEFSELLVNQEIEKMVQELKDWVANNGMEFDQYIKSVGKSLADLKLDFTPQAIMRIKVALVLQEIAKKEGIKADEAEIDKELDELAKTVGDNKEAREYVYSPAFRDRIEHQLKNRKTVAFLKEKIVK